MQLRRIAPTGRLVLLVDCGLGQVGSSRLPLPRSKIRVGEAETGLLKSVARSAASIPPAMTLRVKPKCSLGSSRKISTFLASRSVAVPMAVIPSRGISAERR